MLKQNNSDFHTLITLVSGVVFGTLAITMAAPGIEYIKTLFQDTGFGEYSEIMLKCIGIGFAVQTAADICKECGENAIASKVELVGKAEILLIAVPLIKYILELTGQILG